MRSVYEVIIKEQAMSFVYEDISKEDFEKFGIGELKAKYPINNFDRWVVNDKRNIFLLRARNSLMPNDDAPISTYLMNIDGLWVDVSIETVETGGTYKVETWVKYAIEEILPFVWDVDGKKQYLTKDKLPISHKDIVSTLCDALTVLSKSRSKSTKHDVFFENLTASEA
jgi:hypothetical protein